MNFNCETKIVTIYLKVIWPH